MKTAIGVTGFVSFLILAPIIASIGFVVICALSVFF